MKRVQDHAGEAIAAFFVHEMATVNFQQTAKGQAWRDSPRYARRYGAVVPRRDQRDL